MAGLPLPLGRASRKYGRLAQLVRARRLHRRGRRSESCIVHGVIYRPG